LIDEKERRKQMGLEGRKIVEKYYSLEVTAPRLFSTLTEATKKI
jgi:hypothetical protein